jgi:SOS response regulatory protein OraA/RecX
VAHPDAFEVALAALNRKERTTHELMVWLERRGFDGDEVQDAIGRLAEAKRDLSGWGAERIREALLARGVANATVDGVLAMDSHDDQLSRARELLARRGRPLADNAERQRALDYLARRGYEYEIAYEAVRSSSERRAA